jgi:hypothetical protein
MQVSVQLRAPAALPQGKNTWYPLNRRLGGSQSHFGRGGEEKNFQPPCRESNPRTPTIIMVQENQKAMEMNGTHQFLVYTDDVIFVEDVNAMKKDTEALLEASREVGLEVNTEKAKYIL